MGESSLTSHPKYPAKYYLQFLFTFKLWITEQQTLSLNLHSTVLPSIAKPTREKEREKNWTFPDGLLAVVCVHVLESKLKKIKIYKNDLSFFFAKRHSLLA